MLVYSAVLFAVPTIVHAMSSSMLPSNPWTVSSASTLVARLSETGFYQAFSLVCIITIVLCFDLE